MKCDYLIVGAGLFGSVLAERIAAGIQSAVRVRRHWRHRHVAEQAAQHANGIRNVDCLVVVTVTSVDANKRSRGRRVREQEAQRRDRVGDVIAAVGIAVTAHKLASD